MLLSSNLPFILKIQLFYHLKKIPLCCVCDYSLFSTCLFDTLWKSYYLHLRFFISLISLMISISLSFLMCFQVVLSSDYLGHKFRFWQHLFYFFNLPINFCCSKEWHPDLVDQGFLFSGSWTSLKVYFCLCGIYWSLLLVLSGIKER